MTPLSQVQSLKPNYYKKNMQDFFLRNVVFHLFFFFLSFTNRMVTAQKNPVSIIRVGVVLEMNDYVGQMGLNCISMALSEFYATHGHYKTRLVLFDRDSKGDIMGAAAAALDLVKNIKVQAIIGPQYSGHASFLIALGNKAQVPIITFSATSPSLSSFKSPYFVRATLSDSSQVNAIGAIVKAYGWREVVLIYEDSEFGEGIIPFMTDALEEVNARVPYRSVISSLATDDQITVELLKLMTMQTRVFVVHMLTTLGSRLFLEAKKLGMMSEDYVWIITDGIGYELNSLNSSVIESMEGVIGVRPYTPKTEELDGFNVRYYKKRIQQNNTKAFTNDLNVFGLWAYDAAVALAMAAEEAGLRNPKFKEVKISKNATDLEAFGVSNAGQSLVRALSTTTFKGLAGNFQLVGGQLQSPPYEIINLVGHEAQGVGYWTKDNGIVKDLNVATADTKVIYSTSRSNFGPIIWPGHKKSPAKGWVIPTKGKKLRIGIPIKDGFAEFVRVTWRSDNSTKVEGHCIDVFEAVMKELPYGVPYEYIPFATPDHKMAGTYNDLTQQVYLGNYDAVVGDVTIVANRSQYVDFTLPFMESGVTMVVPYEDDKRKNALIFMKPLTWELWLTSFFAFVGVGFIIWVLEHRINEDFRGPRWYQVGTLFSFIFSTMVFAHKEKVVSNLSRFVLITWFMVVFVLTQSYTASLTSMLTVQRLNPTIKDVNELVKNKGNVGYKNGSFVHGFLLQNNQFKIDASKLVAFNSAEEMDELFSKGSKKGGIAAAFHEIPYLRVFNDKYCSKYTMVDPVYKTDGFGFVFPKGSPLVPDISRAILNITESKTIMEIDRKWWGDGRKCRDSTDLLSHEKSLGLGSFMILFSVIAAVGGLALIIYVITFLLQNWRNIVQPSESDPPQSIREKILELFDKRDLTSHTFKISTEIIYRDENLLFECPLCRFFSRHDEIRQGNSPRNQMPNPAPQAQEQPQEIELANANQNAEQ